MRSGRSPPGRLTLYPAMNARRLGLGCQGSSSDPVPQAGGHSIRSNQLVEARRDGRAHSLMAAAYATTCDADEERLCKYTLML